MLGVPCSRAAKLVVADARVMSEPGFAAISVTAEKWVSLAPYPSNIKRPSWS